MGKSSRNRSTLAMLNEGDQQTVITYMKDNNLINTEEAPVCVNEKCKGFQSRKMK
jgi:hypothetical protein